MRENESPKTTAILKKTEINSKNIIIYSNENCLNFLKITPPSIAISPSGWIDKRLAAKTGTVSTKRKEQ